MTKMRNDQVSTCTRIWVTMTRFIWVTASPARIWWVTMTAMILVTATSASAIFCYHGKNNNFTLDHSTLIGWSDSPPLTWIKDNSGIGAPHFHIRQGLKRIQCRGEGAYVCVKGTFHNATTKLGKKTQVASYGCADENVLTNNDVVSQFCPPGHENKYYIQDCLLFTCGINWCNSGSRLDVMISFSSFVILISLLS